MRILDTPLRGVKMVRPLRHGDARGWFAEVFNAKGFREIGLPEVFAQDNQSMSSRGVLRGLHYQVVEPQGKLVRVLTGKIWDVAVDLRKESEDFGKWVGFELTSDLDMLWIPEGFAHGFLVLSETAEVLYKTTRGYFPEGERCIRWDDADLGIEWPLNGLEPAVSAKDAAGVAFQNAEYF
jgi:dTDP-4-dehydrorhamnose 3,5-epimerase